MLRVLQPCTCRFHWAGPLSDGISTKAPMSTTPIACVYCAWGCSAIFTPGRQRLSGRTTPAGHSAAMASRYCVRLPACMIEPGSGWSTISSARRATSISLSRSTPVSMPSSLQRNTTSSVQTLPAAPFNAANGQPPRPATELSKRSTPISIPA